MPGQRKFNKTLVTLSLTTLIFAVSVSVRCQAIRPDFSPAGRDLPPGVPRVVDTNGNVFALDTTFTTKAYQQYAAGLLLKEANRVAQELRLHEDLPITVSNVVWGFISPFGFAYAFKAVGNISTTNYSYGCERDYKFSDVTAAKLDDRCREYTRTCQLPISLFDTNTPYELATQWLAAVGMDVNGLNRDYDVRVAVESIWNHVQMGELPKSTFVPIYWVCWLVKGKPPYSAGGGASVELFLPTRTLLSLEVDDSKYILRKPLNFANIDSLFPPTARITTNSQMRTIYVSAPPP